MRAQAWIVTLASLAAGASTLADPPAPRPTLADVVFIAGHWKGDLGGTLSEEIRVLLPRAW